MHLGHKTCKALLGTLVVMLLVVGVVGEAAAWQRRYFTEQEVAAIRSHLRYRVWGVGSYDFIDPHEEFGNWAGLTLGFSAELNEYVTPFVTASGYSRTGGLLEDPGAGVAAAVGVTLTPIEYLSSTTTLTFGSNSLFLPRWRVDEELGIYIPLASNFSLGIHPGAFYAQYFTDNETVGVFIGPTLYIYRWLVGYTFTASENYPGEHVNYTHRAFAGYSRDGWFSSIVSFQWGDVIYEDQLIPDADKVEQTYWEVAWAHTHWVGVNWGLMGGLRYGELTDTYEIYGGNLGAFYEF
jgi:YaiO family outer membrane protein